MLRFKKVIAGPGAVIGAFTLACALIVAFAGCTGLKPYSAGGESTEGECPYGQVSVCEFRSIGQKRNGPGLCSCQSADLIAEVLGTY